MARWQKRARMGVGLGGLAVAIAVYAGIGEREAAPPVPRPARLDPRAILESAGAAFRQFNEAEQEFVIEAERQLTYEDGTTKFIGATIRVQNRGGRDFTVSGREGQVGEHEEELEIVGDVILQASDGFTVTADRATFSRSDSTVRVPGAVAFHKGRMSGSGARMTYNEAADLLTLEENARVRVVDDAGRTQTEFTSSAATLARRDRYLALDGRVRSLRGEQVLEADRGVATLSEDGERITFIELRGNARVAGGGAFDHMHARDIDLDYTDNGEVLERVSLRGGSGVVMGAGEGGAGRQFLGDSLDLTFASDSTLTAVLGQGGVTVVLPAAADRTAQQVTAQAFDGSGEPGRGLTAAQFAGDVVYREEARAGVPARLARSAALRLTLMEVTVGSAQFTGGVRFEEAGLLALGARADYEPGEGLLRLAGAGPDGGPRVTTAEVQIEGDAIDVTLEGRRMRATGTVKTVLRRAAPATGGAGRGAAGRNGSGNRLPGLLDEADPVNVNANALDYQDAAGVAVYSGNVALWQGETAIRGERLTLDRNRGDLVAAGAARSNIVLDTGAAVGRAEELRYEEATRMLTYTSAPAPAGAITQVSGPPGDLRARRIELALGAASSRLERIEAYTDVNVRLEGRVATGDRLTYEAADERYVMTGVATVPVTIVDDCRETSGRTVTFFKSGDRVIVDGNEEVRTRSSRSGPCPPPAAR